MPTNSELVRSIFDGWSRGDFSATGWADPEIEMVVADGPSRGAWTGLSNVSDAWRYEVLSAWQDLRSEAEEIRELDQERVLVLVTFTGRGRASGVEVEKIAMRGANLFHFRTGKVTRLVLYWRRERALADLGLAQESGPTGT